MQGWFISKRIFWVILGVSLLNLSAVKAATVKVQLNINHDGSVFEKRYLDVDLVASSPKTRIDNYAYVVDVPTLEGKDGKLDETVTENELTFTHDVESLVITITPDFISDNQDRKFTLTLPVKKATAIKKVIFYLDLIWEDSRLVALKLKKAPMYLSHYGKSSIKSGRCWVQNRVEISGSLRQESKKSKMKRLKRARLAKQDSEEPGVPGA